MGNLVSSCLRCFFVAVVVVVVGIFLVVGCNGGRFVLSCATQDVAVFQRGIKIFADIISTIADSTGPVAGGAEAGAGAPGGASAAP